MFLPVFHNAWLPTKHSYLDLAFVELSAYYKGWWGYWVVLVRSVSGYVSVVDGVWRYD